MITNLEIQHYRSIENLYLRLQPINIFVGQNGVGKSNIIDAIKLVRDALRDGLDQAISSRHGISSIRQWSPTKPYNISIRINVDFDDKFVAGKGVFGFTIASSKENYSIQREELQLNGKVYHPRRMPHGVSSDEGRPRHVYIKREKDGSIFKDFDGNTTTATIDSQDELFANVRRTPFYEGSPVIRHLMNFESYTIFPNTLREPQKQSNEPHLMSHGENLASIMKIMRSRKKNEAINEIISGMQKVVPDLENITTQAIGGYIVPRFYLKPKDKKRHAFDVNQMSDGTLRVLGLLVALYQDPGPSTIALEEPELTIHPGLLQLVAEAIKEVSERRQIFVTTHSPELLDHFEPEQIVVVEFDGNGTSARQINRNQKKAVQDKLFRLGELMSIEGLHG